ncbi:hypothetical protein FACS1894187_07850 [Synergistales bacterium]|nr:hypothetical protein FACS1894187_07850 [Synergistales bacterium]
MVMTNRVSTMGMFYALRGTLQSNLQNLLNLQTQMLTQKKYSKLSDNPSEIARALSLESSLASNANYISSQTSAIESMNYTDGALSSAVNILQKIRTKVINAGDGALDATSAGAIADEIDALKRNLMDALNAKMGNKYIFGGTKTDTAPFVLGEDGQIKYVGSDERIRYEIESGVLSDISFTGLDVMPNDNRSYFVCSSYVPLDWGWEGREEKVQITVGNRTISVFIPEQWIDEVSTGGVKATDYNRFRDPDELSKISLDDLATLVNRALVEQGADMLVKATVEKNYTTGQQRLMFKSNTGERVGVTGWPTTDYQPMPQSIAGLNLTNTNVSGYWDSEPSAQNGLMGVMTTLGWRSDGLGKSIDINLGGVVTQFDLDNYKSVYELVQDINATLNPGGNPPLASVVSGRLALQSKDHTIEITDSPGTTGPTAGGVAQLFGADYNTPLGIRSSKSSLEISIAGAIPITIYINDGDTLERIADRINAIEGLYSRTSVDGDQLVVTALRTGDAAPDPLAPDAATEKLHYPYFTVKANGAAINLFDFGASGITTDPDTGLRTGGLRSKEETRPIDHSHMDVFDYLGMETALKSREFKMVEKLTIGVETSPGSGTYTGEPLHWRIMSGSHETEIVINPGVYDMAQLAERIKNAGAGWLDISVDVQLNGRDAEENGLGTSANFEADTARLVIRGLQGQPVVFMDMNSQRYAEELGLSTALRADADTGVTDIVFPDAICLDENLPAMVRVQKSCGQYFDVRIKRSDVYKDDGSKTVDRVKVMNQIAKQVNEQAGFEMMKVIIPVNVNGAQIPGSASLVALTGEPFEVVDLPVMDPNWVNHSGGIASQMGIHGGVTANMELAGVTDNTTMGSVTGLIPGTIRFESLGRFVEIDVNAADTVESIMDRLRSQAGDWLYVNYFDPHMGALIEKDSGRTDGYGDYPLISIAAKDCSPVNVIDVNGNVAETLTLNTAIQGKERLIDNTLDPSNPSYYTWQLPIAGTPGTPHPTFTINVAGYSHTIDLLAMRDKNGNGFIDAADLVETINSRMQDYDVRAEINKGGYLVLWSPRGYGFTVEAADNTGGDITETFLGTGATKGSAGAKTPYRGGYELEDPTRPAPGVAGGGTYYQNVSTRAGANTMTQNFFGVLNDVSAAIRAENRDGLADKLLPMIDKFLDTLLRVQATNGAQQARYDNNIARLKLSSIVMTEAHDELIGVDLANLTTELAMAQSIYQASLGIISYIVQPTLLDYLR